MNRSDITKYLDGELGIGKTTAQGLKYNCPKCDHGRKYNLEINLSKVSNSYLLFHCWACHYKGPLKRLLTDYASSDGWKEFREVWSKQIVEYVQEKHEQALPLTIPYYLSYDVNAYLLDERQLDENILHERRALYCYKEDDPLFNHIIFPYYESGKFIGFSSQNLKTKRYKNHRGLNFIPYKDLINSNYPIIITEGIYDSLSVPNAIPMLGTNPSTELLKWCKDKKVILCLDNDIPIEDKKKVANSFKYYGTNIVLIFDLKEYKDLNDYRVNDKEGLNEEIKEAFNLLLNVTDTGKF